MSNQKLTREQDGFFHLHRTDSENHREKSSEEKKIKKVSFKKGSWKDRLYKMIKKHQSTNHVKKFHFTKLFNFFIQENGSKISCSKFRKKYDFDKNDVDPNKYLLINTFNGIYTRISSKSYRRLCLIDTISISFRLRGTYDDIEVFDIYEKSYVIDNLNDLMRFINQHRCGIDGVYELVSQCSGFTYYDYDIKMVVKKKDGTVETYHSDMNDFMEKYGLLPF